MKKIKFTKESISITLVLVLSALLNFINLGIEGYANEYYAAGVKSMTLSLKNFFFVSFDPAGFVTIDKPPLGFWAQAVSAKIFGFSGWSILFPEALAGVVSVALIYYLVKRNFGHIAGLISAICLAVTPVFVAASRNNTIDNLLVVTLLLACAAFFKAAEKGKVKLLILSLALVGLGFNIKMLEAYMIGPAIYLTYLLAAAIPVKKRIQHLVLGSIVLLVVSFAWAAIVDLVPASSRPFVGSSTNNSELELIIGHNGLERLGLSGNSGPGGGMGQGGFRDRQDGSNQQNAGNNQNNNAQNQNNAGQQPGDNNDPNGGQVPNGNDPNGGPQGNGQAPDGNGPGAWGNGQNGGAQGPWGNGQAPNGGGFGGRGGFGGQGGLQGSFGGQTTAGFTRLFSKNMLSDQIVWFLPLALIGFAAAAIKEKLRFKLDNEKKLSIVFWIVWLVPEFIYFSFTKGLFHPYYLTMLAPPIAALAGIGITTMWEMYKEGGWKSWLLPASLLINGAVQALEVSYFYSSSNAAKFIMIGLIILCLASSIILALAKFMKNENAEGNEKENSNQSIESLKKILVSAAFIGLLIAPTVGSAATWSAKLNGTIPAAGLELLSSGNSGDRGMGMGFPGMEGANNSNSKLIQFLKTNAASAKYQVVVSSANSAGQYILNSDISVMALGGFSGSDKILTLDQFKEKVKKGEVRYVLSGGMGGRDSDDIMTWVKENGTLVDSSLYKDTTSQDNQINNDNNQGNNNDNQSANANGNNDDQTNNVNNDNSAKSQRGNFGGFGGRGMNEQLYDLQGAVK